MLVPPHRSLVQISITLITLPVVLCSIQVDLGLDQTVGDNQRATGDFYLSNIDEVDKYPAPAPILKFITDNVQQSDIQNFLQWIHPPEHPKCDSGLFAFCCNWPAPSQNIGIRRPPNVDPGEVKKRRRNCGKCECLSCRGDRGHSPGLGLENEILFRIKEFHVYEHSRR